MSTIAKVFTVLNLVFALFLLGTVSAILSKSEDFKGLYEKEQESHRKAVAQKDADIAKITADKSNSDLNNRNLSNQKSDLESELTAAKADAEQARNDNNQLRASVEAINGSLKTVQAELGDLQGRNKQLMDSNDEYRKKTADAETARMNAEDDRARLEGDLQRAHDDGAEKERLLTAATKDRENLNAQLSALVKKGVDVAAIIGNNVKEINGTVLDVGGVGESRFVVLSVGENDGVQLGFPFHVYRGDKYVGRVVVNTVYPGSCTARVTLTNDGVDFAKQDAATTRL